MRAFFTKFKNFFFALPEIKRPAPAAQPIKQVVAILIDDDPQVMIQLRNLLNLHLQSGAFAFDIGIFQDGFDERTPERAESYNQAAAEALKLVDQHRFVRQDRHLGPLAHKEAVEWFLYESLNYDAVVFLEALDLAPGFFDRLANLGASLARHPKVAAFTVAANGQTSSIASAEPSQVMAYTRHAWQKTQAVRLAYRRLFEPVMEPYQRQVLVSWWLTHLGFKPPLEGQQAVMNAVHRRLGMAEVSVKINPQEALFFAESDFDAVIQSGLDEVLLDTQAFDPASFARRLTSGDVFVDPAAMVPLDQTTIYDLLIAYKWFLKRSPENFSVVQSRIGAPTDLLFKDFLLSNEFLAQETYWPTLIEAAKKVIELSKAKSPAAAEDVVKPVETQTNTSETPQ